MPQKFRPFKPRKTEHEDKDEVVDYIQRRPAKTRSVRGFPCPRCTHEHVIRFRAMTNPPKVGAHTYQFYGVCEVTMEPVFLSVGTKDSFDNRGLWWL